MLYDKSLSVNGVCDRVSKVFVVPGVLATEKCIVVTCVGVVRFRVGAS